MPALDLAVGVATDTHCLEALPAKTDGPVLLYAAGDAQPILRERSAGLAAVRRLSLEILPGSVIVEPVLRLEAPGDQERPADTIRPGPPK